MADGRMIKRVISNSRRLSECSSDSVRLLYTWLIPFLDVNGRYSADPAVVRGNVVPRLKGFTEEKISNYLAELHEKELITIYEVDGDRYFHLRKFFDHQSYLRPDKEAKPTIPDPDEGQELVRSSAGECPGEEKRSKEKRSKEKQAVEWPLIPSWIEKKAWDGFFAMRTRIKKPLTPRAVELAIMKLEKFKDRGFSVKEILEQSDFNEWQDLYEPKPTGGAWNGKRAGGAKGTDNRGTESGRPGSAAAADEANAAFRKFGAKIPGVTPVVERDDDDVPISLGSEQAMAGQGA